MARCFTHYWKNETWDDHEDSGWFRLHHLEHAAGNLFESRGVGVGDLVYIVTVKQGRLFLGGRMRVEKITAQTECDEYFGESLWPASTHLIASKAASTPMRFDCVVPGELVRRLRFVSHEGPKPPCFDASGQLDRQTLRGVRELTRESAALLDSVLEWETQLPI